MPAPMLVAKHGDIECFLLPGLTNRHGLITGATGTGKTVTLQVIAERLSSLGVPVFMADVKGDLAGLEPARQDVAQVRGAPEARRRARPRRLPAARPCSGTSTASRATRCARRCRTWGRCCSAASSNLNDTQEGVLTLAFKIADDAGLLLLDLKDLRALLQHVGDNAQQFQTNYGNVSAASIGAIQRGLLGLEQQGADRFMGEPMLDVDDLLQTVDGKGVVNILAADRLMQSPKVYSTLLLWLLSELYERLPEVGDPEKPKLVFFFDEAHLLFTDAPKSLLEKIEQVVRLIRSKGVGVFFVTQNPLDVPDTVLGQLGNRVQHALRAFTPRDQKAVKSAAETMRANPKFKTEDAITELGVGEALVSFLDEKGRPGVVERVYVLPPASRIGPITPDERKAVMAGVARRARVRQDRRPRIGVREAEGARDGRACGRDAGRDGRAAASGRRRDGRAEGHDLRLDGPARRPARRHDRRDGQDGRPHGQLGDHARDRARRAGLAARREEALNRFVRTGVQRGRHPRPPLAGAVRNLLTRGFPCAQRHPTLRRTGCAGAPCCGRPPR